jgi:hypothetical protein
MENGRANKCFRCAVGSMSGKDIERFYPKQERGRRSEMIGSLK